MVRVTHFSDPGCPFAYSALPALSALRWRYGDQLAWRHVMIGLTESGEQYEARGYTPLRMSQSQRDFRRHGMPFARAPKPRMAGTSRACRLVVAVRRTVPDLEWAIFRSLHFTQFTTALPLDSDEALRDAIARVPGLYAGPLLALVDDPKVVGSYEGDRAEARSAAGSPAEFQGKTADTDGAVRYTAPTLLFERGDLRLEAGGFQPLEAYDVLIANLDPSLERRGRPEDLRDLLRAFPHGLTTREVATCLASGNEVPSDASAEDALLELADRGAAVARPLGDSTLWLDASSPFAADRDRIVTGDRAPAGAPAAAR